MVTYIARRIGAGLAILFVIAALGFVMLSINTDAVVRGILGPQASEEQAAALKADLGLDQSLPVQFIQWLGGVFRGDLGRSWFTNQDVNELIGLRLPISLSIVIVVLLVTLVVAVLLGLGSAYFGGWFDRATQILCILGFAIPGFLLALILVTVFGVYLGWAPVVGFTPITDSLPGWMRSVTLPTIALASHSVGAVAQQVRNAAFGVLNMDYVRTLRSRGIPEWRLVLVNVLRNSTVSGITVLGLQAVGLLGAVVLVDKIFAIPGIGEMTINYTVRGDRPAIMGLILVLTVLVIVINLLVDVFVSVLNPKVRTR
ncbi:ABC transporter permease [Leucobacter allii]|uniref:ABC transporter permease n=1 Tax=Leucobacter allii TaxID=2932247 RepID=UPI001FD210BF|nr:ABC transporter permease [Leucobacter allii]UOR02376.1 ABC transporter permease [Leucobacter allii]